MARCDNCMANKVCDHNKHGFENCGNYIPNAYELAKEFTCFVGDHHKVEHCPYLEEVEKAKSEVERLNKKIDVLKRDRYQVFPDGRLELLPRTDLDKIKAKVAREIFEEIEELIYSKCFSIRADRDVTGLIIDGEQFAELKKKYTEGG